MQKRGVEMARCAEGMHEVDSPFGSTSRLGEGRGGVNSVEGSNSGRNSGRELAWGRD